MKEVVSRKKMHTRGRCQNSTEENKRRYKCEGGGFKEENAHKGGVRIVLRRIRGISVKEVVSRKKMHTREVCQNSTEENKRRHKCMKHKANKAVSNARKRSVKRRLLN